MNLFYKSASHQGRKPKLFVGFFILAFVMSMTLQTLPFHTASGATPGSITVCKMIINGEGNITNGSELSGEVFSIDGFTPDPETSSGAPVGTIGTSEFETPLNLDSDLIGDDEENDAQCVVYDELELGGYYYDEEVVPGENWETPLYNDQFTTPIEDLGDFFPYDSNLFDGDTGNDGSRDQNVDGHIMLTEAEPNRTLVVLNQLSIQDQETEPTPTPELTPTPTPEPSNEPTPTPEPSNEPTPTPSPTSTPEPTPTSTPSSGGGGNGPQGNFINGPLSNPPQVAGASTVATPTPQVAGALTVLPATGASAFDRTLLSLFTALMLTGALMMLAGYEALPRKLLRKIR